MLLADSGWFLDSLGWIGLTSAAAIVFFVTLRSVLEIMHLYGFLPSPLERSFRRREREAVADVVTSLGLDQFRPDFREQAIRSRIATTELVEQYSRFLTEVVRGCERSGTYRIGRDVRLPTSRYVALREELVNAAHARSVARALAAFIGDEIDRRDGAGQPIEIDRIAGLRDGSPLLAALVAEVLGVPCVLVGERPLVSGGDGQDHVDGQVRQGDSVALIDDSTTDGRMLLGATEALRRSGATVNHAFVVFVRSEGTAEPALEAAGVSLHSVLIVGVPKGGRRTSLEIATT